VSVEVDDEVGLVASTEPVVVTPSVVGETSSVEEGISLAVDASPVLEETPSVDERASCEVEVE